MTRCELCHGTDGTIASSLGVCVDCIRSSPGEALAIAARAHASAREPFDLPPAVPDASDGAECKVCANGCSMPEGGLGYCGLRSNEGGRVFHRAGIPSRGLCEPYYDPHPTNCVAQWLCPGADEFGKRNLAVFYLGCSMDCLYCQNWHCRMSARGGKGHVKTALEVASMVDARTTCVCFFGGDPGPHSLHALRVAYLAMGESPGTRICWETNGAWAPKLRERMIETSLDSGGIVKVDLKAGTDEVHRSLTGRPLGPTLDTIEVASGRAGERPELPLLVVSTLLVPGYVDAREVAAIAERLAGVDPPPPLSLLAFHPDFEMRDLPPTSLKEAEAARAVALDAGLERVHLGNVHVLW